MKFQSNMAISSSSLILQVFLLVSLIAQVSCSGYSATGGPGKLVANALTTELYADYDFANVRDVAVLPIEGLVLREHPEYLAVELNNRLIRVIDLDTSLVVRNASEEKSVANVIKGLKQGSLLSRAKELNTKLDSDGVFYASIREYRSEDRSRARAAEVAFRVWFLPRGESSPAWSAIYRHKEEPLSENLFRMKEALSDGLRYKNAMQLSERGFRALAREFEILRKNSNRS